MSRLNEWMQLVVSLLTAATLGIAGWLALRKWLKGWVKGVAEDSREAARQLTTSNGKTVAEYVEQVAKQVADVSTLAQDTARRADAAATLAEMTSRRLDEHMVRDHAPDKV